MFSGFSRRQLLKLIGGLIAGATAVGSIPLIGKLFVSPVQAQQERTTNYKDVPIVVRKDDTPVIQELPQELEREYREPVELYVGGRQIAVVRNTDTGRYQTRYLPNNDYATPEDLAKDVIDFVGF